MIFRAFETALCLFILASAGCFVCPYCTYAVNHVLFLSASGWAGLEFSVREPF